MLLPLNVDITVLGVVMMAAAAPTDLKMIDTEMQAILAELLMPGPQPAVQPQLTPLPYPMLPENAMTVNLVEESSQPPSLPQQLLQAPGELLHFVDLCSDQVISYT